MLSTQVVFSEKVCFSETDSFHFSFTELNQSNEIHFAVLGEHLLKDDVMHFKWHLVKCHFWFQPPATGLLADKLRKIFDESWERGNTAMKEFSYCCHFQITSERTTIIYNLLFTAIKFQTGYRILIKLPTQKVCYEDPGNKNDWFMKKLVC